MERDVIVSKILEELTTELPIMFRALPDVALWRAMTESVLEDEDVEVFATKYAVTPRGGDSRDTLCCDAYTVLRDIVNNW